MSLMSADAYPTNSSRATSRTVADAVVERWVYAVAGRVVTPLSLRSIGVDSSLPNPPWWKDNYRAVSSSRRMRRLAARRSSLALVPNFAATCLCECA
jgi:hypothetical protein